MRLCAVRTVCVAHCVLITDTSIACIPGGRGLRGGVVIVLFLEFRKNCSKN